VGAPEQARNATVILGGTVAGTQAGYSGTPTAAELDAAPRINYANGGVAVATQLEVKTLLGTGRVSWNNTGGYNRDVAVGTLLDPGTSTEAGLIKRHTAGSSNDLVMRPGSTMAFDIFGATAADADQIDWTGTGVNGMVFNEANLVVRLFEPADSTGILSWILINGDEWILKSQQDDSTATALTTGQSFASTTFKDLSGNPLNLYTGPGDSDGGWDLGFTPGYGVNSNAGTDGNRQVVITGEFHAVPEPAMIGLAGLAFLGVIRSRRGGTKA
jgi:hypothetical protein